MFGDSSRNGEWAAARLLVDGDRIVEADAPGLERDVAGLTLLEAAAVGGETLAVDALANALGPVFRAAPAPGRVAVAMSGGVDSAVALLRSLPNAVGVTLRLWLDPEGPDSERACCSPESVIAARETCHRLGVPARDARPARGVPPRGRRARSCAATRAAQTPNPVHPLQRRLPLRRAARLRASRRRRAACDRPLRADRRARRQPAARARRRPGRRIRATCSPRSTRKHLRPDLVPARRAGQGGDAGRGRARRARGRTPTREPGGVLPRGRRLPRVPRPARARRRRRGRSSTRTATSSAGTTATGGSLPGSGAGSGSPPPEPLYVLGTPPGGERRRRRSRASRSRALVSRRAAGSTPEPSASTRSSATARPP